MLNKLAPEGKAVGKEKTMPCVQQQNEIQKNQHDQGWIQVELQKGKPQGQEHHKVHQRGLNILQITHSITIMDENYAQFVTGFEEETSGHDRGWSMWEQQITDQGDYTFARSLR